MKRLVDFLIVLVVLAIVGLGVFFVAGRSNNNNDTPPPAQSSASTLAPTTNPTVDFQFPALTDDQQKSLLSPIDDLPVELRSETQADFYIPDSKLTSESLRREWPEAADRFDLITATYGWEEGVGVRYNTCHLQQPISEVGIEIDQFASAPLAQAFIDDPLFHNFLKATFFDIRYSTLVHGVEGVSSIASEGDCYPQEKNAMLYFEYWGLFFSLSMDFDAAADPAQMIGVLNSLVPPLLARADALASSPLPPTPIPSGQARLITEQITIADLPRLMPYLDEFDQSLTSTYSNNSQIGKTYTLDQFVQAYRDINLTALADAIALAGLTHGMIGQEARVWEPSSDCPNILGLSLEVDFTLFESPAGARDYMMDPTLQQAWKNTGLMTSYVPDGDSVLMFGQIPGHHCGPLQVVGKMTPYERLLVTVVVNSYSEAGQQDVLDIVDIFSQQVLLLLYIEKLP
ncbi:MAG: hypothetical protein HY866_23220 [Chloroflexi bacterium]|nr:hypothetical protein [Chloroflexota bacterium]